MNHPSQRHQTLAKYPRRVDHTHPQAINQAPGQWFGSFKHITTLSACTVSKSQTIVKVETISPSERNDSSNRDPASPAAVRLVDHVHQCTSTVSFCATFLSSMISNHTECQLSD
jgi:hypothetical protein